MTPCYPIIQPRDLEKIGAPILVSTFMRSGTHLTIDLLRRNFPCCRSWKLPLQSLDQLYLPLDVLLPGWEPPDWSSRRALTVLRRPARPILKTHFLDPDFANLIPTQPHLASWLRQNASLIHVRRDPREALMSLWALLQSWKPEAPDGPDEPFIRRHYERWLTHTRSWQEHPRVLSLDFHEILAAPGRAISQIASHTAATPAPRNPLLPPTLRSRCHARLLRVFAFTSPSTSILVPHAPPPWNPAWDSLLHA